VFTTLLGVLHQGLVLWNSIEGRKYLDRVIKIKKEWNEEYEKPLDVRSDQRLDDLESELRIIAESFIEASGAKNSQN